MIFNLLKNVSVRRINCGFSFRMATFTPRDLAKTQLHSEMLISRFVRHLVLKNVRSDTLKPMKGSCLDSNYSSLELRHIPNHQLVDVVINSSIYKSKKGLQNYTNLINDLDKECSNRVRQFNFNEILHLLHGFLYAIPSRVSRLSFYKNAMEILVTNFDKSADNFVQICFFLGMWKKNRHTDALMTKFIDEHFLEYLDGISTIEFCIVCTALYKTSIKQKSDEFAKRLANEITAINPPIDESFLVTFIKSCRHNAIKSTRIKEHVKSLLLKSQLDRLRFVSLVHLLAYYAQNLYNDQFVCEHFVRNCVDKIRRDYRPYHQIDLRGKDLATFLWSCGQLNLNILTKDELKLIEDRILDKISRGEYNRKFIDLVDACLSLWILNYKSEKLVRHAFEDDNIIKPELDYRANLLKSCIQIENPEFLKGNASAAYEAERSAPKYVRDKSPNLMKIFEILRKVGYEFGIRRNHIVCPINFLYIPGIRVQFEDGTGVNLEILEWNHLLEDGKTPTGIFSLKTRLLKCCGCNVVQINSAERSDNELAEYVKTVLQKFLSTSKTSGKTL